MTVGELGEKIKGLDPKTTVVAYVDRDGEIEFFEIADVNLSKGTPQRNEHTRKAGFRFHPDGPAEWLFIQVETT